MIFAVVENNVNIDKFQKRMFGKAIHDDILAALGDNAPVYSVAKIWLAEFERGRNSVEVEHYLGCPKDTPSTKN